MYLFVGERRSPTAIERNLRWEDGQLSAKRLFDALISNGVNPREQTFINMFEDGDGRGEEVISQENFEMILSYVAQAFIVGMGQKVQRVLVANQIEHIGIVHPAALGIYRSPGVYTKHVKEMLGL